MFERNPIFEFGHGWSDDAPASDGRRDHAHGHGPGGGRRGHGHGPGGGPRGGGPRGFGGGRRRTFDAGELHGLMLLLMETRPRHGYDVIREIETRTGGAYAPSPGMVYPTLRLLEEQGLIEATSTDGPRQVFGLTAAGRAHLEDHRKDADGVLARLEALRAGEDGLEGGPVGRAVQNLQAVLRRRYAGSPDRQALLDAADLIDEVARRIERS